MSGIATGRLQEERKSWRKVSIHPPTFAWFCKSSWLLTKQDHPPEFYARPKINPDKSTNLLHWECGIPGRKEGKETDWAGGIFVVHLIFSTVSRVSITFRALLTHFFPFRIIRPERPSVFLYPSYSTRTSSAMEKFAWTLLVKTGRLQSLWNKSCWEYKNCWLLRILRVLRILWRTISC